MRLRSAVAVLVAGALLPALLTAPPTSAAPPDLDVEVISDGLVHPWAIAFLPDGSMLYTQRVARTVTWRRLDGTETVVMRPNAKLWSSGETGLMGIEVAHDYETSGEFFICTGYRKGPVTDVRVVAQRLDEDREVARFSRNVVIGLPATTGRHGGCALQNRSGSTLFIGTGDAAIGTAPQNKRSGGGKVLRVDSDTGEGLDSNPFADAKNAMKRRVFSYGHRNVQGLAKDDQGRIWSVEHGSSRDDEANLLRKRGNYGWNPVPRESGDPAYNERSNSPMTDHSLPGIQRDAVWDSGSPTIATSGATFVYGSEWGEYDGALVMAALKGQHLRFLTLVDDTVDDESVELSGTYGRLRGARQGPDGALYVTTSNGSNDKILRITPAG